VRNDCHELLKSTRLLHTTKLLKFDVHVTVHRVKFLTIKPTRCTNFSNLLLEWNSACFGQFLCPSSGVFHCIHSSGICHTGYADSLRAGAFAPAHKLSAKLYDIYHCCVYSEKLLMMEQRNCPKHVEFHSKNKFEKLVHIVGLIIRNLTRCTVTWTSESLIRLLYHCFSIHEEVNGFERCNRKILADWRFINWDWIFCVLSAVLQCLFLHETKEDLLNYFS